jgi:hypothetical protein
VNADYCTDKSELSLRRQENCGSVVADCKLSCAYYRVVNHWCKPTINGRINHNMYTNIPVRNTVNILSNNSEISVHIKIENILLTNVIVNQNYFEFNATCYKQIEGLGIGIPTSALFAEAFLQWLEHMFIIKILL